MIDRQHITGLVLAGGRGSRMGGVDKGLVEWNGATLVEHALHRLAAQVGPLAISANRHLDRYAGFGCPVWPDATSHFDGPLTGFLAGLRQCRTDYLMAVPCDTPNFPADLVSQLAAALEHDDAELAVPCTVAPGGVRAHPVFCLLRRDLADDLERSIAEGVRRVEQWTSSRRCARVRFDDAAAFANANTREELDALAGLVKS